MACLCSETPMGRNVCTALSAVTCVPLWIHSNCLRRIASFIFARLSRTLTRRRAGPTMSNPVISMGVEAKHQSHDLSPFLVSTHTSLTQHTDAIVCMPVPCHPRPTKRNARHHGCPVLMRCANAPCAARVLAKSNPKDMNEPGYGLGECGWAVTLRRCQPAFGPPLCIRRMPTVHH